MSVRVAVQQTNVMGKIARAAKADSVEKSAESK